MGGQASANIWLDMLYFPLGGRVKKPRNQGLTMVIDKGLGLGETRDLLSIAGDYIDFIKLGFGTSALYDQALLEEKIHLAKNYSVDIYPGGTFLEVAVLQDKLSEYLMLAKALGYTAIEVSDGTVNISSEVRDRAISMAVALGFKVLTEVGKKDPSENVPAGYYVKQILRDLENGAFKVIIEGRESGKNVGVYDQEGLLIVDEMDAVVNAIEDTRSLIWEAPLKEQQQDLILLFGPNVNLGNISPYEVMALEALRVGLRGDTLRSVCDKQ